MRWIALLAAAVVAALLWLALGESAAARASARREADAAARALGSDAEPPLPRSEAASTGSEEAAGTPSAEAKRERWRFRVVGYEDEPLPDAIAEAFEEAAESLVTRTVKADGAAVVELEVAAGERVRVSAPGHSERVLSGRPRSGSDVRLAPGFRIAGRVVDGARRPLAVARVVLDEPFSPDRACTTDAEGRFAFDGVAPDGEFSVSATAAGFPLPARVVAAPGDDAVEIVLSRPRAVSGVVLFPDGEPAEGARVGTARTDAQGRFGLEIAESGTVEIAASWGRAPALPGEREPPPAFGCRRFVDLSREVDALRLVLEAHPRSFAVLRVLDARGDPVREVTIGAAVAKAVGDGLHVAAVRVPPGATVRLFVGALPRPLSVPVHVTTAAAHDAPPTEVRLPDPRRVTVIVRGPDGEALPRTATAEFVVLGGAVFPVETSRDRATFEAHPAPDPEHYFYGPRLVVRVHGYAAHRADFPGPALGDTVEVRLPRGATIRGRVREPDGGAPTSEEAWVSAGSRVEPLGADGRFEFAGVEPGAVRVLVSADGGRRKFERAVTVREGDVVDLGDMVLGGPVWVAGVVTDSSGRGIPQARVEEIADNAVVPTRDDGSFRLRLWPGFGGWLVVRKPGYAVTHHRVEDPSAPQAIRLPREGRIVLRWSGPRGRGATGYGIRVAGFDEDWQPPADEAPRAPREERVVRWRGVPPGRVTVFVVNSRGRAERDVDVAAGATTEVAIEAP